jgi:arginyl-tRNA synthetase
MDSNPTNQVLKLVAQELLNATFTGLTYDQLLDALDVPSKLEMGDFSIMIPKLNKFKKAGYKLPQGKPDDISRMWAKIINDNTNEQDKQQAKSVIISANSDGSYLNIFVDRGLLISTIVNSASKDEYGLSDQGEGKKIYVEYSSPNIAKPFHAGHLRSTLIGSFLCKIHEAMGYSVRSENYLGDWGKQYGLLAVAYERYGDTSKLSSEPIKHLFELYVKINQMAELDESIHDEARAYFKKMESGDEEALKIWKQMREMSIVEYKKIYNRLGVKFDHYGGESMHSEGMKTQLSILTEQNILSYPETGNGAACVVFPENSDLGQVVVKKKDGATLYITRDIAAAVERWDEHHFDKMYYVVAVQQDLHFKQLFAILKMMGYEWADRCEHVNFGMVKGMSTRRGDVVFLTDILDEAKQKMLEQMISSDKSKYSEIDDPDGTSDIIGMSSVYIQDMSSKRIKGYTFDWDRITSFEGDTGPYLQYNHARLCGINRKVTEKFGDRLEKTIDFSLLTEPEARILAHQIAKYPFAVSSAFTTLEPSNIVNYLFNLCHAISSANSVLNVMRSFNVNTEEGTAQGLARLALFNTARKVLKKGLNILGLEALEKM